MFDRRLLEYIDWTLILTTLLLLVLGLAAVYSASKSYGLSTPYFKRQLIWVLIGILVMVLVSAVNYRFLANISLIVHLFLITLLVLVLLYGTGGPGSPVKRWLRFGGFFFQPSEYVKFSLILSLTWYFSDPRRIGEINFKQLIIPSSLMIIPFVLILKQPDLGTAGTLVLIFVPVIFLVGLNYREIFITFCAVLVALPFIWFFLLKPYQKNRILTLLNPDLDPLGTGYHIIQSKIAIGSGEAYGKGFLQGTQAQLNFLPARHTDFIFSLFAEEWGFLGAITLVLIYFFLIFWCLKDVGKSKDRAGTILVVGVTAMIASHVIINIGMVIGLLPVVGMPLPFFSYGGSAMLTMMSGIGLILNVRMRRFEV